MCELGETRRDDGKGNLTIKETLDIICKTNQNPFAFRLIVNFTFYNRSYQMPFFLRALCLFRHQQRRRLYDAVDSIKCVRDRGLDHAVEREGNLKPVLNLKNLIKSEPSKAIPLSLITQSKDSLQIPFRPIEFIRRYPSVFEEFLPGGIAIHPHIKLTPQVINYDKEEEIIYRSVDYKQEVADRLLKLLMISRINKIPLSVIDKLKWDMGLPQDYVKTIFPEFPDYFRVINEAKEEVLELVCWSNELAVSVMEKRGVEPVEFCLTYSNGFEMDKKYKKWVAEWQKLPYVSPYENAQHLASKSDESDKWAVAVLHEILNLFIGRKVERDTVLGLGEYLGLRSRFKRALLQHPAIFYVSSKIRTHTVVLKEAYKRGMLLEKHPLMQMRFRYVQLMNAGKEVQKSMSEQRKTNLNSKESQTQETYEDNDISGYEDEDLSAEEIDDENEDEDDNDIKEYENVNAKGRGDSRKIHFDREGSSRHALRRSAGRQSVGSAIKSTSTHHQRTEVQNSRKDPRQLQ